MAEREIIIDGDPVLRRRARSVRRFVTRLEELVADMFDTLQAASGLGLAAPQIGVSERVIVIQIPEDYEDDPAAGTTLALANPEVVRARGEQTGQEGCLSVPRFYGQVCRAAQITVKGADLRGREVRLKAEGLLARVLQHEIDHLDGVLFIDKVEDGTLHFVGDEELEELGQSAAGAEVASGT
ncbi:MAG: peptide deformylase [Anaerolineae bacterium]|nr:peptide deformylase [Anaerolineae bacterium]